MVDRLEPYRQWLGDSMKKSGRDWYMAKCPSHEDKHRSLRIHVNGNHDCMANCGEKGDAYIVAQKVGLDQNKYARHNTKNDYTPPSAPKIKPRNSSPEPPSTNGGKKAVSVTDVYLENKGLSDPNVNTSLKSDIAKHHKYLMENFEKLPWQLSKDRVKGIELGMDHANVVVIPIRDADGELIAIKKHKGNQWGDTKNKFYPAERIAVYDKDKTLIITAGEHDCEVAIEHYGFQCATVTGGEGSIPSDEYWTLINGFAQYVIIYDNDSTGKSGARKMADEILRHNPTAKVKVARWSKKCPDKWDVADSIKNDEGMTFLYALDQSTLVQKTRGVLTMSEFNKAEYPDDKMIVEHMLQERQVSILAGDSGVGKSWLTLEIGLCVATGNPVFGHFKVDRPRKVLLFQFELTSSQVQKRMKYLIPQFGVNDNFNIKVYDKRIMFDDRWDEIDRELSTGKFEGGVIIVDNLYTSLGGDKDPSNNRDLQDALGKMTKISDTYNVAVMIVSHHYKGVLNKSINPDHIIGGKFLFMNVSYVLQVKQSRLSVDLRVAMFTKLRDEYSNLANIPWKLHWNPETHTWTKGEIIPKEIVHYEEAEKRWEAELVQSMKSFEGLGNNPKKGGVWSRENIWTHLQSEGWKRNPSAETKVTRFIKRVCDWGLMEKIEHNAYIILDNELTANV